ncbi:hypothetical protein [Massilia rubra]|uniref:Gluconolaconase n=1 Tax=Massilia rubra TaxID=2607910 RepID=A0ABX0LWJ1_9BURK|nr:hypothetical protein [Massilia rubra]NHZ38319.1 hypothetical protein [Massilia rubra]
MHHTPSKLVSPRFPVLRQSTAVLLCCVLTACGGSGGSSPSPAPAPETPVGPVAPPAVVPVAPPAASRLPHVLAGVPTLLQAPAGVAVDKAGNTFVIDSTRQLILKITPAGEASTFAGSHLSSGSEDGQGTDASFRFTPNSRMLIDMAGNLIVADTCNGLIRRITPQAMVSTVAGVRGAGCSVYPENRDGLAAGASFSAPESIVLDVNGDYLVGGGGLSGVRRVTPGGKVSTSRWVQPDLDGTGSGSSAHTLAVDKNGVVYFSSRGLIYQVMNGVAKRWAGTTERGMADGPRLSARFDLVTGMVFGASGDLYVSDYSSIRHVSPDGIVSTLAGVVGSLGTRDGSRNDARFNGTGALAIDPQGQMIVADAYVMRHVSTRGDVTTFSATPSTSGVVDGPGSVARFERTLNLAADSKGNVYIPDPYTNVIRRISPDGTVSWFAGVAGVRNSAVSGVFRADAFANQKSIAIDAGDVVHVADVDRIVRIDNGVMKTVVTLADEVKWANHIAVDSFRNIAVARLQDVWVLHPEGDAFIKVTGNDVGKLASGVPGWHDFRPAGVAFDGTGNLYIADLKSHTILKRDRFGVLSVFAGTFGLDGNADGAPGQARLDFNGPVQMTFSPKGEMYLAGLGKVRKITPDGTVSTPALAWGYPSLNSIVYSQNRLLGMTAFAILDTALPD